MIKLFIRSLFILTVLNLLISNYIVAQTINVGTIDPGPYGSGSSITAPITVSGNCVTQATTYTLYLSNASGSFASQKAIGTFDNFYATFVNGVIPAGTAAGSGYKVRVVSSNPTITSAASASFSISSSAGVTAAVSSQLINPSYPEIFGVCTGKSGDIFSFVNKSTSGATVKASFFNETSQQQEGTITPNASGASFTANAANYTITVKATLGGIVGTMSYMLVNNAVNTNFGVTGNNTICLTGTAILTYNVDFSANGIKKNFPGLLYNVHWGDASTTTLTYCQIVADTGKISHNYLRSSCGNTPNGQNNSFEVDFQPTSLYCGTVGTEVTSYAQVVRSPTNTFTSPIAACLDSAVIFPNISDPGEDPANTTKGCKFANSLYTWLVDGNVVATNYTFTQNFVYKFTTTGIHKVTLRLQNPGFLCTAADFTLSICIQKPPQPKFTLPATTLCLPARITPGNQSFIDANCNTSNQYVWTVTGPAAVSYANNTSASSAQPQFVFNRTGAYKIQLGITTASCGTIESQTQTVYIDSAAVAKLSPDGIICGTNEILNFNTDVGPTKTTLSGSSQNGSGAFLWTVSGGGYSFEGGTSDTSKYPQIKFTDAATYTITVSNTNQCAGAATATQHLTFRTAPQVSAGDDITSCANKPIKLQGIAGTGVNSFQWTGGTGIFSPGPNVLNPTYTPSGAEMKAGTATLTLVAQTSLAPPCNTIASNITLTLIKPDSVDSAPTDTICSGAALNYQITGAYPNSTFTWTVDASKTSASASGYTPSGSGAVISDKITDSDPAAYAMVTYNITAVSGTGCPSDLFPLTVYIAPQQALAQFTQDVSSGCDKVTVHFTNTSVPANISYTWNFGDGSAPSTVNNPVHTFIARTDGRDTDYTVTLTATSNCGASAPFSSIVTVRPKIPIAYISPGKLNGCAPFTLTVDNLSPGNNIGYNFYLYDGSTLIQQITKTDKSQAQFTAITPTGNTQYTLYMVATGFCGFTGQSNIIPITISPTNVIAQMFVADGKTKGCVPFSTNFINNSTGGDTYVYHIYDANHVLIDSLAGGPATTPFTFNNTGIYYVTIVVTNSCASTESQPLEIDVNPIPAPQFSADVLSGCKNLPVTFTNLTADAPNTPASALQYDWDFGDGVHSVSFTPPTHIYNYKNSPYTVTLTATNVATDCSDIVTKADYITVAPPPSPAFTETPDSIATIPNYHFSFFDETANHPMAWSWTFGDGQSSNIQNPGHTYADSGTYKVTLIASAQTGCDSTVSHYVRVNGIPGELFLPNAFEPDGVNTELNNFKAKGVGIKSWHMQIFNNYAQLIWETTKLDESGSPAEGWDGTYKGAKMPQGVYVWQVTATFVNGSEWKGNYYNNSLPKRTGVVHLIR